MHTISLEEMEEKNKRRNKRKKSRRDRRERSKRKRRRRRERWRREEGSPIRVDPRDVGTESWRGNMICPQTAENSAKADTKFQLPDPTSIPEVFLILCFSEDSQVKDAHTCLL